jgi:O-antigen ligase
MFGSVLVLTGSRGLETTNPDANPLLGAIAVGGQVLFVAAGACRVSDDSELDVFAGVVSVVGILLATWAMAEFALNEGLAYPLVSGARRAVGPFGNPNYFGALLASLAVLCLAAASNRRQQRRPIALPAIAAAACSAGVVTTLSRGAMLGLLVGIVVLLSIWSPRRRRRQIFALSTVLLVIVTSLAWRWIAAERVRFAFTETDAARVVSEADEESLRYRFDAAKLAFSYTLEHPWLGIGLNRFPAIAERDDRLGIYMNTHNEPLRISSEAGLPAFFLLVFFVWTVVARIQRRRLRVTAHVLPVMACYGVTSLFLNGLGNVILTFPVVAVMFLAAGIPADAQVRRRNLVRAVPAGPRR